MKRIIALAAIALCVVVSYGFGQCPDPNAGVQSVCRPAPAWVHHTNVITLANGCRVIVDWCDHWVCRGVAGLSRSVVSISKFIYLDNTCEADADLHITAQDVTRRVREILEAMVHNGVLPNDGPPPPCGTPNNDQLYEVQTGQCFRAYQWGGTSNGYTIPAVGFYPAISPYVGVTFCASTYICRHTYKMCTETFPDTYTATHGECTGADFINEFGDVITKDEQGNPLTEVCETEDLEDADWWNSHHSDGFSNGQYAYPNGSFNESIHVSGWTYYDEACQPSCTCQE